MWYLRVGRSRAHRAEVFAVALAASLPGIAIYFVLRLLTDAIFPPRRRSREDEYDDDYEDDFDDDEPPPRRRRRRSDDDYEDDYDDRPRAGVGVGFR